jgi:o-succinylbenzoate synthase
MVRRILTYKEHFLKFAQPAGTSRGVMKEHQVLYIYLSNGLQIGVGEAAPLPGLSVDDVPLIKQHLAHVAQMVMEGAQWREMDLNHLPALKFAMEAASLDLEMGGKKRLYKNSFVEGGTGIPINGLVWMNDTEAMLSESWLKVKDGYTTLKFKIGSLDFDQECRMLETFRKKFSEWEIQLRLDANGAFHPSEALEQLNELKRFHIHSIEQPIKQGQWEAMHELCVKSPIDIALDEELIGVKSDERKMLLNEIKPKYIILKPTLIGGLAAANEWIKMAHELNIGWWATSALESNIGLNAIAQWVAGYHPSMPQGLGTGKLYTNNWASNLKIDSGKLYIDQQKNWGEYVDQTEV